MVADMARSLGKGKLAGAHLFLHSRVTPIAKRGGGLRPIVGGDLWYRFLARIIGFFSKDVISRGLLDTQCGVGSKGGCESILLTLRELVKMEPEERPFRHVCTLDLANAFGNIDRRHLFAALQKHLPTLIPVARERLGKPTTLHAGGALGETAKIKVSQGLVQGDPLSPALFSVAIRATIEDLCDYIKEKLGGEVKIVSYLDDLVVLSSRPGALEIVKEYFAQHATPRAANLRLNVNKSSEQSVESVAVEGLRVLGGFVGPDQLRDDFLQEATAPIIETLGKLEQVGSQDAWLLPSKCIHARARHLPRFTDSETVSAGYDNYDQALLNSLGKLRGKLISATGPDIPIAQASLRQGGLGLLLLATLCPAADAALHIQFLPLAEGWLGKELPKRFDSKAMGLKPGEKIQRQLTTSITQDMILDLLPTLSSTQLTTLAENKTKLGSEWLRTVPLSSATTMKSDDFSGALQIRMLADGTEATCQRCDQASDHRHAECCAGCRLFQTSRHEAIKVVLYAALSRTKGAKVELEQRASADRGPDRTDLRMDRKLAPEGGVLDIDIAVITSGSLACRGAAQRADTATNLVTDGHHGRLARVQEAIEGELRKAAVEKTAKYAEHVPGRFMAFIISNGGLPDSSAETLLRYWAKVVPGWKAATGALSITLQSFRARTATSGRRQNRD